LISVHFSPFGNKTKKHFRQIQAPARAEMWLLEPLLEPQLEPEGSRVP
jgi:hypothetical protein